MKRHEGTRYLFDLVATCYHRDHSHPALRQTLARDFERLCLWLVEREGYERAEHLVAAGSEHRPNDRAGIRHLVYRLDARYNACSKILRRCEANSGAMI
jgi:hypothetical protein